MGGYNGAMDVSHLIDSLNDAQREAVCAPPGHYLVLAGAGSGKTRVLTHRIGWLTQVEQVPPWAILAVTFTNKAAGEMRARLDHLIPGGTQGLTVGTFHGIAHRLLRRHWREAGLPESFQILDSAWMKRAFRRARLRGRSTAGRTKASARKTSSTANIPSRARWCRFIRPMKTPAVAPD
jgi:DNA helicase-2/ATP-dependent DNA helicase PcrA